MQVVSHTLSMLDIVQVLKYGASQAGSGECLGSRRYASFELRWCTENRGGALYRLRPVRGGLSRPAPDAGSVGISQARATGGSAALRRLPALPAGLSGRCARLCCRTLPSRPEHQRWAGHPTLLPGRRFPVSLSPPPLIDFIALYSILLVSRLLGSGLGSGSNGFSKRRRTQCSTSSKGKRSISIR